MRKNICSHPTSLQPNPPALEKLPEKHISRRVPFGDKMVVLFPWLSGCAQREGRCQLFILLIQRWSWGTRETWRVMYLSERNSYDLRGVATMGKAYTVISHNLTTTPQRKSHHHFPFTGEESKAEIDKGDNDNGSYHLLSIHNVPSICLTLFMYISPGFYNNWCGSS